MHPKDRTIPARLVPLLPLLLLLAASCAQDPASSPATPAPAASAPEAPAALEVVDARVHPLPNGMGAGYLRITGGAAGDHLAAVTSPVAETVEMHESLVDAEGMMRMEARPEGFEVPAGGELVLESGGRHLMFLGLAVPDAAAEVELHLQFRDAGERTVAARVVRPGDAS